MAKNGLPIEAIPGSKPLRFRWCNAVNGRTQVHDGMVMPSMEGPLRELIAMVGILQQEIAALKKRDEVGALNTATEVLKAVAHKKRGK